MDRIKVDGRFVVGPQPDEEQLKTLAEQGFRTVVNFRAEGEPDQPLSPDDEGKRVLALGMNYLHIPVRREDVRADQVDAFRRDIDILPGPVYAHCHTGRRSGAFVMMKKAIDEGVSGDQVIDAAERMGFRCDIPEMKQFVKRYVDAHTRPRAA